jgi:Mn-dependent DtxR family transcriptional regulator
MAIHDLIQTRGYARVTDVSKYLEITKGSASITLKNLKSKGLVQEDENKFYQLTEKGLYLTEAILTKRHVVLKFLTDVLQIEKEQAEVDACKIEHLVSDTLSTQILLLLQLVNSNEFGCEISQAFKELENKLGDVDDCTLCVKQCIFPKICSQKASS